jgi:serine/threonine-protein kinase
MRRDTWDRLDAEFFKVLELPAQERAAYLDAVCGDDPEFRREIDAVLAAHAAAGGTVDSDRLLSPAAIGATVAMPAGVRVGAYELEAVIGRGGMGEVYRARRADAQYEQQVAIKLMRAGRDTAELMRRFRTERQILARLQHPNIATLLDGGVTDAGQPYLVMQYVDGVPITRSANDRGLDLEGRLRLFTTVCDAVQFAHANLVVHRDLKPSNILVTGQGEVRLLDFGIAKLLDLDGAESSTTGDLLLLTPEHAAPEQFLGGAITTATDVYALGVLLYELLVGFRPFQFVPAIELHRAVCEQDPRSPSAAAADSELLAKAKLPWPVVRPAEVTGDLDSIVLKALRKEPNRRYGSVAELADDIRRHLSGFPVQARPETFGYVAGRYIRRHRVGIVASVALAAALITLAMVSVRFAVTSRAQARAIAEERDVALQVSSFLENLFKSPDPFAVGPSRRDSMRIGDFLAEGARKVRQELLGQPVVQARLLTVLGRAQTDLGRLEAAIPLLEEAVTIRRRELGPQASETAITERTLGIALWQHGRVARAESLLRKSEASLALDSLRLRGERVRSLAGLGSTLMSQGRFADAESVYRHALALAELEFGPTDSELGGRLSDLAMALSYQAKRAPAESLLRRSIVIEETANGKDHPRVATPLGNLATLLIDKGELEEAEQLARRALQIQRSRLPTPHPRMAGSINNLAAVVQHRGRFAEAESLFRQALAMQRQLYRTPHQSVGGTLLNLAGTIDAQGDEARSLPLKREALEVLIAGVGPTHPTVAIAHNNIGVSLHLLGRHRESVEEYERALAIRRTRLGDGHPLTTNAMTKAGQCLLELRRYPEAEARLKEAFQFLEPRRKEEGKAWESLLEQMVRLYRAMGREDEAGRYRAMRAG